MNDGSGLLGARIVDGVVRPEWIDINNHMNVAWYVAAFDMGVDELWSRIGITDEYMQSEQASTFAVEAHVTYQRELVEGDRFVVTSQLLAYDEKRIHQFMRLYHAEKRFLSATAEWLNLHVDLRERKVSPWPERVLGLIAEFAARQDDLPYPDEAGRQMRVPKPIYAMYTDQ